MRTLVFPLLAALIVGIFSFRSQAQTGTVDAFNPEAEYNVYGTAVQADGKVLACGPFVAMGGVSRPAGVARLNADGSVDPGFNPAILGGTFQVYAVAALPDGRVLLAGSFHGIGPYPIRQVTRLNTDGSVDSLFSPNPDGFFVSQIVPLMDGKTLILGDFTTLGSGSIARSRLARLNGDGTVDPGFVPPANTGLSCVAALPDGKVLVGTNATINGVPRSLARLATDGSLDPTFVDPGISGGVFSMLVQPNGKILINGCSARLNADGTSDATYHVTFNSGGGPYSFALQADGGVVLAGEFSLLNSQVRQNMGRVYGNGGNDASLVPATTGIFWSTALQGDGRAVVSGSFQHDTPPYSLISGVQRGYLARLYNDPAVNTISVPSQNAITWTRGGTAPEASAVRFELSTDDGTTWTPLGAGTRISGAWQLTGLSLPASGRVRGLAIVPVTHYSGQSSSVISFSKPYAFAPAAQVTTLAATNPAATSATLNATVNPNGGATTALFQYGITTAYGSTLPVTLAPDNGNTPLGVSVTASGLPAHVEMHYRVVATNASGTSHGEDVTFVTNATPSAPVLSAGSITENNAAGAIVGTLGPATDADGDPLTYAFAAGSGDTDNPSFVIVGNTLRANYGFDFESQTSFTVRVRASDGFANGDADAVLTVAVINVVEAPIVTTLPAGSVRHSSAALNARVNANSNATTVQFEWGETTSYGHVVPLFFFANDNLWHEVQTYIGGLGISGTYHYRVTATNAEGSTTGDDQTFTTRTTSPGDVELAFNPDVQGGSVQCMAVQPDGRILLGGSFSEVNGVPRNNLARLYANGTLDLGFNPDADGAVNCISVLPDGRLLIGGNFSMIGATARSYLVRLLPAGTLDPSFQTVINGSVEVMVRDVHTNKIYIAGSFSTVDGLVRGGFARLGAAGYLDSTLPDFAPNGPVQCMALDISTNPSDVGDGSVLVGGSFSQFGGHAYHGLVRVIGTGISLGYGGGPGFPTLDPGTSINSIVRADDIFYIGGSNISYGGGAIQSNLAKFTNSGIFQGWGGGPDPVIDGTVLTLAAQTDGKILFGGQFASVNGQPFACLARLNTNGTLDTTFDAGPRIGYFFGAAVTKLALQADGRVLTAGNFSHFGGEPRQSFGRLVNSPATHALSAHPVSLPTTKPWVFDWTFAGAAPLVTSAGLEYSTDGGLTWVPATGGVYAGYNYGSGLLGSPNSLHTGQDIVTPRLWRAYAYLNGTDALIADQILYPEGVISDWRLAYFGSAADTGAGADSADPDGDGVVNLLEYAFGSAPTTPAGRALPEGGRVPDGAGGEYFEIRFTQPTGITGITYGAEWSSVLGGGSWTPVPDTGVSPEHVFRVAIVDGTRGFMRIVVTRAP